MENPVEIELLGGLGNQLFGYFLGLALAENLKTNCILFKPTFLKKETNHNVSIEKFSLGTNIVIRDKESPAPITLLNRILDFLSTRFLFAQYIRWHLLKNYTSRVVGYDENVWHIKPGVRISGYFQSYKYLDHLKEIKAFRNLKLVEPSDWYLDLSRRSNVDKPIFIHVRRGDYARVADTVGLVGAKYYALAVQYLRSTGNNSPIWVVSDEIELAKELFRNETNLKAFIDDFFWISPPKDSDPAESLMLMTGGTSVVIANSTFSWWAAQLGQEERTIICPIPWFKEMDEPELLIPDEWVRIGSNWS